MTGIRWTVCRTTVRLLIALRTTRRVPAVPADGALTTRPAVGVPVRAFSFGTAICGNRASGTRMAGRDTGRAGTSIVPLIDAAIIAQ
jgi:hypothetical protein